MDKLELRNDKPEQDSLDDGDYVRFDSVLADSFTKRFTLRLWDQVAPYDDALESLLISDLASHLIVDNFWNRQLFVIADGGDFAATLLTLSVDTDRPSVPVPPPFALFAIGLPAIGYVRRKKARSSLRLV